MPSDFVQKLKSEVSIENYISRFVKLNKSGKNLLGLCPFHNEKTPSFNVSREKQIYHCFGCGASGDIFNFAKEYHRVDFTKSMEILSEFSGIAIDRNPNQNKIDLEKEEMYSLNQKFLEFFRFNLKSNLGKLAREYLLSRKIPESSIDSFKLGYAFANFDNWLNLNLSEKETNIALKLGLLKKSDNHHLYDFYRDRIIFPIIDTNQKVVGFGGRIVSADSKEAKYINSPASSIYDKGKMFFNLNQAGRYIREKREVYLVEGYLDVIGLHSKEIENVVAPLGTSVTEKQIQKLKSYADKVVILFDGDQAGKKAAFRATEICIKENLNSEVVLLEDSKDPFDLSKEKTKSELSELLQNRISASSYIIEETVGKVNQGSKPEDKKMAVNNLFEFIKSLKSETDRETYLQAGSKKIGISFDSLNKDFEKGELKSVSLETDNKKVSSKIDLKGISSLERRIAVLFLEHPELKSNLDEAIEFEDQSASFLLNWIQGKVLSDEEYSLENFIDSDFGEQVNRDLFRFVIPADSDLTKEERQHLLKDLIRQYKTKKLNLKKAELGLEDFKEIREIDEEIKKLELENKQIK